MAEMVLSSAGGIAHIALQIKEAIKTVHQNEEECRKIASCVEINSGILQRLVQGTDITEDEVMCRALEDVKITFEDALKLVKKCQNRHIFCRFFSSKDMANDLNLVLRDIGLKMQQASLCGTVQGTIVSTRIHYAATITPAAPPPPPRPPGEEDIEVSTEEFTRFSLYVLNKATNNFSDENKIGEGGFSSVYKGVLHDGLEVAIKKFHKFLAHGNNVFFGEFNIGTNLRHKNVVSLLGYCIDIKLTFRQINGRLVAAEDRTNFLVLGYVPNGSLEETVAGTRHIDWSSCFKVIQEIAQGVHYIHEQRVIHLDLNPSNILFDSDMIPVITDFGLSKVLEHDGDEMVLNEVLGTVGYMAPEQYSSRVVSLKSDVFVFGIILLRTITGENAIMKCDPWSGRENWEQMLEESGGLKGLVDPTVQVDQSQLTEINRCMQVGMLCTESDPADRPSMADVVDMLSGKKKLLTRKKRERIVTKKVEQAFSMRKLEHRPSLSAPSRI